MTVRRQPAGDAVVLVVDDSALERAITRDALELAEFAVVESGNGACALERFEMLAPDIVLLDVNMPRMSGFDVCTAIRAMPNGAHVPILMMTGLEDVASIERSYDAGATDFFTKPINPAILTHRLRYLLRGQRTADALRRSEARLAHAKRLARLGHWEWDIGASRVEWSAEIVAAFGRPLATDVGVLDAIRPYLDEEDVQRLAQALEAALRQGQASAVDHRIRLPDGGVRVVHQEIEAVLDAGTKTASRLVGTAQDITQRVEAEDKIRYLAYFDPVTELPNRSLLKDQLERAIALARCGGRMGAVLFLDLDDFKRVNDTCGHEVGDEFLRHVAARLAGCVRGKDRVYKDLFRDGSALTARGGTLARLGGDEFVILLSEIRTPNDAMTVVRRVRHELSLPFQLSGREFHVTCSTGVSVFPADGATAEEVLRNADMAMYHAKSKGRNRFQFFTRDLSESVQRRTTLEACLREALEREEFVLHYQPRVEVSTGRVVGAEALVRWNQPGRGLVPPAEFIPLAEETGLIVPLGAWVLRAACRQARTWRDRGVPVERLSVNLSGAQFKEPKLNELIAGVLHDSGIEAGTLELELTESVLMDDAEESESVLAALKALGVRISIDDFGIGYSSLSYLKRFPIDTVKIDRAFVGDVCGGGDDAAIVASTIKLGHALRLQVVAEGVETDGQMRFLREQGCDECQGYLIARPLTADELECWLEEWRGAPPGVAATPEACASSDSTRRAAG